MRRSLSWGLTATLVLTAVALWMGDAPSVVPQVKLQRDTPRLDAVTMVQTSSGPSTGPVWAQLPAVLPETTLEPALRDIFHDAPEPPAPRTTTPPPEPVIAAAPPPVPVLAMPAAPPMTLRYLGAMRTPEGQPLVFLARGETSVPVAVGDTLEEGYIVESIAAEGVALLHPPTKLRVVVPIPALSRE